MKKKRNKNNKFSNLTAKSSDISKTLVIIYWFLSVIFKKVTETKLVENYITSQKQKNKMIKMQQKLTGFLRKSSLMTSY